MRSKIASASLERCSRLLPSLRASLSRAEREKRTAAVERKLDLLVQAQGVLERSERLENAPLDSGEQPAAACAVGERRDPLQAACVSFVPVEELARLIDAPEREQRLDVVGDEPHRRRLAEQLATCVLHRGSEPSDRVLACTQREVEVPERRAREQLGRPPCGLLDLRQGLGADRTRAVLISALGLDQGLEREAVDEHRPLPRLLRQHLSLDRSFERAPVLADQALAPAEEDEEVWQRAFVAQVPAPLDQRNARLAGGVELVRPPPEDGQREEWLPDHTTLGGRLLEIERATRGFDGRRAPEDALGKCLRPEGLCRELAIAQVEGQPAGQVGVVDGLVQPLPKTEEARCDAFVRRCEDLSWSIASSIARRKRSTASRCRS